VKKLAFLRQRLKGGGKKKERKKEKKKGLELRRIFKGINREGGKRKKEAERGGEAPILSFTKLQAPSWKKKKGKKKERNQRTKERRFPDPKWPRHP